MSRLNFDEVKLFEDTDTETDVIRHFINTEYKTTEESFYILDVAEIVRKHQEWIAKMPRVIPHYAVKCNPDLVLIKTLAAMNVGFDCASVSEIQTVMEHGVPADKIIFANPTKWSAHIKFAKKMNVQMMTVDSEMEIIKISNYFPDAKIVIRIRCDAENSMISLGAKFGCDPDDEAIQLIHLTKSLGLKLWGFSFHVGCLCGELNAYGRGIRMCKRLIDVARSIGCKEAQLIDIGGGFPGEKRHSIDKVASIINDAIQNIDPSITIISEPGRYYATSAFTLVSLIHTKKIIAKDEKMTRMYYMTCGVYNSFIEEMLKLQTRLPVSLSKPASDEKFISYIWGPTCDSIDCILENVLLPEFHPGEWLIWRGMGAYTISLSCSFNGFSPPKVQPFIKKSHWKQFLAYVNKIRKSKESIL
ncbi:ornithine decarboxylase 2-like [Xylocopa sonorina]|uniref:ornithine decarboxylase 2-like n=1 Tax=Xylocopa sonorina TaxID=1818115 RepID=UPI00403B0324